MSSLQKRKMKPEKTKFAAVMVDESTDIFCAPLQIFLDSGAVKECFPEFENMRQVSSGGL